MGKDTGKSLEHYVRRTLLQRLVLMTLLIAFVVGILVYFMEYRRLAAEIMEQTSNEITLLVSRTGLIMDDSGLDRYSAFRQALAERVEATVHRQAGQFLYVGFFKPDGETIDEIMEKDNPEIELLKQHVIKLPLIQPAADEQYVQRFNFEGRPYIYLILPIVDLQNIVAAYTHAIFALSDAAQAEVQSGIWRVVITTILIVLAATLLLYPIILRLVKRITQFSANLLDANLQSISLLGCTIAKRDSDTDAHNYRVTIYSIRLAEAIGLNAEAIRRLIKGAFLHDVGKIGIRDNILLKPGKLDEQEFSIMKEHVDHGMDIVARSSWLADARDVVGGHHEKFGGGGYPSGLQAEDIPITARIFAIADVFDALTSKRPYKEPMSFDKTMEILKEGSGTHFDPELLKAFEKIAGNLYEKYCGRDDMGLHEELEDILRHYFTTNVESMMA